MTTTAPHPTAAPGLGQWDSAYHAPVMVQEVVRFLGDAESVLDGTLGGGGHSAAMLEAGATVFALDRDPAAIGIARRRLQHYERSGRFHAYVGNYAGIDEIAMASQRFDGILLDLGVSSHQLDDPSRGFSFREGAPLDMRMGADVVRTAADLLNQADERQLIRVFREYADEPKASRLAREIVRRRTTRAFETSDDLVGAIRAVLGPRSGPAEFARLFQAVRIEVNNEVAGLAHALPVLREKLRAGGLIVVIAYHSGEDRVVKHAFRDWSSGCTCPPLAPRCTCGGAPRGETVTKRALTPASDELAHNPRARSARMRVWRSAA